VLADHEARLQRLGHLEGGVPVSRGRAIVLGALALAVVGCASGESGGPPANSDSEGGASGTGGAAGSSTGGKGGKGGGSDAGPSPGSGGSDAGGSSAGDAGFFPDGGPFPGEDASSGSGGALGSGGSAGSNPDAGTPADAVSPPDTNPVACAIELTAGAPRSFDVGIAAGANPLRVEAVATGYAVPPNPTFTWTVTRGATVVPWKIVGETRIIQFEIEVIGTYNIKAMIVGAPTTCTGGKGTASVIKPTEREDAMWIRALPPAGSRLTPYETTIPVSGGKAPDPLQIALREGQSIEVQPIGKDNFVLEAYYVRVTGYDVTARFEAYVDHPPPGSNGFVAQLDGTRKYDLLIVPDVKLPIAPVGLHALRPDQLRQQLAQLQPRFEGGGKPITGTVSAAGAGLGGARVRLRAGAVPSTVGTANTTGAFELRARSGPVAVQIGAPPESGLPDVTIGGVMVPDEEPTPMRLVFAYRALPTVGLAVNVTAPDGKPVEQARVLIGTDENELVDVGTLNVDGGAPLVGRGSLSAEANTVKGVATFTKLPRSAYKLTVIPPAGLAAAITTIAVLDLRGGDAIVTTPVKLLNKSSLAGKLSGPAGLAVAGLEVLALDGEPDGLANPVSATVAADGTYTLAVDPERHYRVFVEPPPNRRIPRIRLGVALAPKNTSLPFDGHLPGRLALTGHTNTNGAGPLEGVVIQVFCVSDSQPECVNPNAPNINDIRPIDETVSAADGSYTLAVPDPAGQ
jgi:hypothetical protein